MWSLCYLILKSFLRFSNIWMFHFLLKLFICNHHQYRLLVICKIYLHFLWQVRFLNRIHLFQVQFKFKENFLNYHPIITSIKKSLDSSFHVLIIIFLKYFIKLFNHFNFIKISIIIKILKDAIICPPVIAMILILNFPLKINTYLNY